MTTPWNAAHWRQNTYRRYKPVAPVGEPKTIDWGGGRVDAVHKCCGYHVCECVIAMPPHGHTDQGVPILYNSYIKRGEAYMFSQETAGEFRDARPYARAIDKKLETLAQQGQLYGLNGASTNLGAGMTSALLQRAQVESDRRFDQTLKKCDATLRKALLDEVLQGKRPLLDEVLQEKRKP